MSVQHIAECWGVQLPPTEKLLLVFLSHHANKSDIAWPATRTILQATGISKATFYRAMAKLKSMGLVIQTRWNGYKAYRVSLSARPDLSHPENHQSHSETQNSHPETQNCSELYGNCKKTGEPSASQKIVSIFKNKDHGMKSKTKMPVGAPLSQTVATKLDSPRKKAGPDSVSQLYREYREMVRVEFNFKLPEPRAKDLGLMKHLVKRLGEDTRTYLQEIISNYTDFRVYFEEAEGEALKGAYASLPVLLKYAHLAENFSEWLKDNQSGYTQTSVPSEGDLEIEIIDPKQQNYTVVV